MTVGERVAKFEKAVRAVVWSSVLAEPRIVQMGAMSTSGESQRSAWPNRLENFATGGPAAAMLLKLMPLHR